MAAGTCTRTIPPWRRIATTLVALTLASTACVNTVRDTRGANPPSGGIASGVDPKAWLTGGEAIPASTAAEPTGNFRFICEFSHLAVADPIVFPGDPGRGHLHMFFGNTGADAHSTYASLRTSGDSTCAGGPLNRSAYWMPAVIDGKGEVVVPDHFALYYKGNIGGGAKARDLIRQIRPMPAGLRMIAGYDMLNLSQDKTRQFDWYCELNQVKTDRIPNCAPGEKVGVVLRFPFCWNGKDLDSADHRSHMAYGEYTDGVAQCPDSHPVMLPQFTLGAWFDHDGNSASWHLSSDRAPGMNAPNGSTFHSDWMGAWEPAILDLWTSRCVNGLLDCQDGQLGNGQRLKKAPDYRGPNRLPQPA